MEKESSHRILGRNSLRNPSKQTDGVLCFDVRCQREASTWSLHDPLKMVGHVPEERGHGPIFIAGRRETPGTKGTNFSL